MNRLRCLFSLLLIFVLVFHLGWESVAASKNTSVNHNLGNSGFGYCDTDSIVLAHSIDTTQGHLYINREIPIEFSIEGINEGRCSIQIDNTLDITHTLDTSAQYSVSNNLVNFRINVNEEPENYGLEDVCFSYISIYVSLDDDRSGVTLELIIINSQYGVFVGYINEECLHDYYAKWLLDNWIITSEEYNEYIEKKVTAKPVSNASVSSRSTTANEYANTVQATYAIDAMDNGETLKITGTVLWNDINGNSHPARNIYVDILDQDLLTRETLGTATTNSSGYFTCTVTNQTGVLENGGCDIKLKINVWSANAMVDVIGEGDAAYFLVVVGDDISSDVSTSEPYVCGPNNVSKAFQIQQAIEIGAAYTKAMTVDAPTGVVVKYPVSDSTGSFYVASYVSISESAFSSADVVLHEYGHYIADEMGIYPFIARSHYATENQIVAISLSGYGLNAKQDGCKLAWQEGWATYFSIAAQNQQNAKNLGVPLWGDLTYAHYNSVGALLGNYSLEYGGRGLGEGHELAVARALWDLTDAYSSGESFDSIYWGYKAVWNYTTASEDHKTLSAFMEYVYSLYGKSTPSYKNMGAVLGYQGITAHDLSFDYSGDIPRISWTQAYTYDSTHTIITNSYTLYVYDSNMNVKYYVSLPSDDNTYTLDSAIWNNLLKNVYQLEGLYWCIMVVPDGSYSTGPYYSQFVFESP